MPNNCKRSGLACDIEVLEYAKEKVLSSALVFDDDMETIEMRWCPISTQMESQFPTLMSIMISGGSLIAGWNMKSRVLMIGGAVFCSSVMIITAAYTQFWIHKNKKTIDEVMELLKQHWAIIQEFTRYFQKRYTSYIQMCSPQSEIFFKQDKEIGIKHVENLVNVCYIEQKLLYRLYTMLGISTEYLDVCDLYMCQKYESGVVNLDIIKADCGELQYKFMFLTSTLLSTVISVLFLNINNKLFHEILREVLPSFLKQLRNLVLTASKQIDRLKFMLNKEAGARDIVITKKKDGFTQALENYMFLVQLQFDTGNLLREQAQKDVRSSAACCRLLTEIRQKHLMTGEYITILEKTIHRSDAQISLDTKRRPDISAPKARNDGDNISTIRFDQGEEKQEDETYELSIHGSDESITPPDCFDYDEGRAHMIISQRLVMHELRSKLEEVKRAKGGDSKAKSIKNSNGGDVKSVDGANGDNVGAKPTIPDTTSEGLAKGVSDDAQKDYEESAAVNMKTLEESIISGKVPTEQIMPPLPPPLPSSYQGNDDHIDRIIFGASSLTSVSASVASVARNLNRTEVCFGDEDESDDDDW